MTSEMHTPGPWLRNGDTVYALTPYVGDNKPRGFPDLINRFSFTVNRDNKIASPDEIEANAILAQHSPDMLEALLAARDRLTFLDEGVNHAGDKQIAAVWVILDAAITSATAQTVRS